MTSPALANRHARVSDGITKTGDILQLAIPLSALAYSAVNKDYQGIKQLLQASLSTLAVTYMLKYATQEERPYQDEDVKGNTFPSAHTSFAFAGAGYWQMRYGWHVGAPMYVAAAFVGYSRHHAKMHNWLDIAAGAALGIGSNILFTSRFNDEAAQLLFAPTNGGAILRFNIKF